MIRIIAILIVISGYLMNASACTNFLISKGATTDGSAMITYVADSHTLYGELYYWPSSSYTSGDSLEVYEWDTGHFLSKIKQVKHTYQVVGNINENQVSIGETTFGGRPELQDSMGRIDYGSLIYITLQRARTAREAINIMDVLTAEYGYFSEGESFSIGDPDEVWILEMVGKGKGNKGALWVAQRIPDGYISGHANQSRITTFPLNDSQNCLYSDDVISFARTKGYFSGEDKDFSFSDAYAPVNFEGARFCESRVWSGFRKVNPDMEKYKDYAMGSNLKNRMPLWIKPDHKLSVKEVFGLMRDYFQGTDMDMTKDMGAGPYGCIVRWRPLEWEVDGKTYFNERAISTQQTGFSFIVQMLSWLPDPIGGILWFGVDDTYSTVYNPIYCGISRLPKSYAAGNGSMMVFTDDAAFWVFNQVSNFAYMRYRDMIPYIQQVQSELENKYLEETKEVDKAALQLYAKSPKKCIDRLTAFSVESADSTVFRWKELYHFLFTRFMDGNVKTPVAGEMNPDYVQPGYGETWYKKIVEETGDKFLYPDSESH
jgi:dipeptidase